VLVLAGGTQAEKNSGLRRVAAGTHQLMQIEEGDTVILSSRIIPGNDRPVFEMMGDLLRRGARLHTRQSDPGVHTSGHAGRSEQRRMIDLVRPRAFLPVHGTLHHLLRHAELARTAGVNDVLVIENGGSVRLDGRGLHRDADGPAGKVAIAMGGTEMADEDLRRRGELGRSGLVVVSLVVGRKRALVAGPEISARGVPLVDDQPGALRAIARDVVAQLERVRDYRGIDLAEELRRAVRRRVLDISGLRPVIEVQIIDSE
jgi:ribonuclease J